MCPECDSGRKRVQVATVVDHHEPHDCDPKKFFDTRNWRALAKRCHDRKTVTQDGGFGNARVPW
jgi:5-methylcytosine-specific restriction protein A